MDFVTVDTSRVESVVPGDEVVILGAQGRDAISATEFAGWTESIPWEVLTMIGPRVERVYLGA